MQNIKNVIFDFGGVLFNLDFNKTFDAFHQLGFPDFEKMYSQYTANNFFKKFETGHLTTDEFYLTLMQQHPKITKTAIRDAWNAMLLDYRLASLAFLETLASRHRLYLLSNTNPIHYEAFTRSFTEQTSKPSLDAFFCKAYYSHLIHLRKPGKEIFDFVIKDAGIEPAETLFIDDSYNNTEAATALGFKVHLLVPGETIETLSLFSPGGDPV